MKFRHKIIIIVGLLASGACGFLLSLFLQKPNMDSEFRNCFLEESSTSFSPLFKTGEGILREDTLPKDLQGEMVAAKRDYYMHKLEVVRQMLMRPEWRNIKSPQKLFFPPCGRKIQENFGEFPSQGNRKSQGGTLVIISDYEGIESRTLFLGMENRFTEWGKELKIIHVPFSHKKSELSRSLVRAGQCVRAQSEKEFWFFNHLAYISMHQSGNSSNGDAVLANATKILSINQSQFAECMKNKEADLFEKGNALAIKQGLSLSPGVFLNNKEIPVRGNVNIIDAIDSIAQRQ